MTDIEKTLSTVTFSSMYRQCEISQRVHSEAWQEVQRLARLGAQLDASSNPEQEISPLDTNVPLDDALRTVKHLTVVGRKPFFNAQRISDCIATVEKLARLGAAVQAMPEDYALVRGFNGTWAVLYNVPDCQDSTSFTPDILKALAWRSVYKPTQDLIIRNSEDRWLSRLQDQNATFAENTSCPLVMRWSISSA